MRSPAHRCRNVLAAAALAAALILTGCGGAGAPASDPAAPALAQECSGACANASSFLTIADIEKVIAQAVAEANVRGARGTIAVVDRVGNVLAVFRMNGASATMTISSARPVGVTGGLENVSIVPSALGAIAKALTGAYLSSEGNAFSTRTASQIIQEHFNPGETLAPGGPLFGVQFSQLPCSDLAVRYAGGTPGHGPLRSPLGLAADPGGFPLYKNGTPVGGVGVLADGLYGLDADVGDRDQNLDELIAFAGAYGFAAPEDRRADRITADGKTLRFSDAQSSDLQSRPDGAAAFSTVNGVAGALVPVAGYTAAAIQAGTAFGTAASGVRADGLDYPGLDAFVLVDATNAERYRPRAGSEPVGGLSAGEVRSLLRSALRVANRTRAQIRRPVGTAARVTISVVDSNGVLLGVAASRDAPVFGADVSVQKARTAVLFSSASAAATLAALPDAVYLDGGLVQLRRQSLAAYVGSARNFLAVPTWLADGQVALTSRSAGNLARPFYPDGVDGRANGPLSRPLAQWSPFADGLQLDLVYNAVIRHVAFVTGAAPDVPANCSGIGGFDSGFAAAGAASVLANGIQIFPGGVPLYRGRVLVGAVGVSGDGVDQDDMVAFLGIDAAALPGLGNAPIELRSDTLTPQGVRLRYVSCPQAPYLDSDVQGVCDGR